MRLPLVLLFLIGVLQAQPAKVKSATYTDYSALGNPGHSYTLEYLSNGFLSAWKEFDIEGNLESVRRYVQHKNRKVLADTLYNDKGEVSDFWEYQYNSKGDLIWQKRTYPEEKTFFVDSYLLSYDSLGRLVKSLQFNKDSVLEWEFQSRYNAAGKKVFALSKFQGENREEYHYDYKDSLLVKESFFSYDQETKRKELFIVRHYYYNEKGLKVKMETQQNGLNKKTTSSLEYFYDESGRLVKQIHYHDGKLKTTTKVSYTFYDK
ncbi:MAG: hypothetical protein MUF42_03205 [Cytophagaceae bacterium]|jgi:hypothetical protein|nr:hypothetical protein [Cytophagaceae bacterium]